MPRIVTYDAGDRRLTPDQRGNEALTRAGRYVGQYYRQIAGDQAAEGQIAAQGIKGRAWPFDVLALEGKQLQDAEAAAARLAADNNPETKGGGGFRLINDKASGGGGYGGGGYGGGGDGYTLDPASGGGVAIYDQFGQTSRGAAALGNYAAGIPVAAGGSRGTGRTTDPQTGQDISAAQVRANQLASAKRALSYETERARLGGGIGNGANSGANGLAAAAANASPSDPNPNGTFSSMPMDQYGNPIPTPIPGGAPNNTGSVFGTNPNYGAVPTGVPGQFDAVPISPDAKAIRDWSAPPGADPSI